MKEFLTKTVAGTLIPSILLPSCTPSDFFLTKSIEDINSHNYSTQDNQCVLPLDLLSEETSNLIEKCMSMASDIINNPHSAKLLAESPDDFFISYGIEDHMTLPKDMLKLLEILSDDDIHSAIMEKDNRKLLSLCKEKGLTKTFDSSDIKIKINNRQGGDFDTDTEISGIFVGVIAVFLIVVAGIAVVVADDTAIYDQEVFWGGEDSGDNGKGIDSTAIETIKKMDPHLYQAFSLKRPIQDTYLMATDYQEDLLDQGMSIISETYPELLQLYNNEAIRQILLFNLSYYNIK